MLGEAVVRVVDLSQDGFSEQRRRAAAQCRLATKVRTPPLAFVCAPDFCAAGKSLLRKEKRLRLSMDIARESRW